VLQHSQERSNPTAGTSDPSAISLDTMSAVLQEMSLSLGDDNTSAVLEIIDLFVETTPAILETLRGAVEAGDYSEIQKGSHSIKSSAASIGAIQLSEIAKELEILARAITGGQIVEDQKADCLEVFARIQASYQSAAHDLQTIRLRFDSGQA